jgi:O-antigen/teichoic acid export membrane protein
MLTSVLVQVAVMVGLSYYVAKMPYRVSFARAQLAALFQFGWPLVLNGLILVAAMQGDRALVGAVFGPEVLAVYATAAILAGAPLQLVMRTVGIMMLPVLGPLRGQPLFKTRYEHFGAAIALAVLALMIPIALLGGFIIPIVFGTAYRPDPMVIAGLAAAGGVSLMRAWTNVAALAVGNSKATLYTNCVRLSGLLLAAIGVLADGGLVAVAVALFAGELTALAFALLRTHRINSLPVTTGLTFIVPTVAVAVAALLLSRDAYALGWPIALLITLVLQLLSFSILVVASESIRDILTKILSLLLPKK